MTLNDLMQENEAGVPAILLQNKRMISVQIGCVLSITGNRDNPNFFKRNNILKFVAIKDTKHGNNDQQDQRTKGN